MSLKILMVSVDVKQHLNVHATELRSCVKVEVVSVDVTQH